MIRGENFITNEFKKCLELTKPGPHAFIIVLSLASRFTNENINVLEFISKFYGMNWFFLSGFLNKLARLLIFE